MFRKPLIILFGLLLTLLLTGCVSRYDALEPALVYPGNQSPAPCSNPRPQTIYYGEYPQSLASPNAINQMRTTPESSGYYISDFDQERYVKILAAPYYDNLYTFDNGDTIYDGDTYYFKVEPILWRVLYTDQNNIGFLMSELILDFTHFDDTNNDYVTSDLRDFLNHQFYDTVFSDTEKSHIIEVINENSLHAPPIVTSTQPTTNDKVFVASYKELVSPAYRFHANPENFDCERRAMTTDYSRTQGGLINAYNQIDGYAFYWTRSAGGYQVGRDDPVTYVGYSGRLWYDANYDISTIGLRVSMYVDMDYVKPNIIGDNDVMFGEYPQTIASVEAINQMGSIPDNDGYYTSAYDQARYAKVLATPQSLTYYFSDGSPVVNGEYYYFKVEPVKWLIIDNAAQGKLLISEHILDTHIFDDSDHEWAYSALRTYMSQIMLNKIFTLSHQIYVQDTYLDNQTTNYTNSATFTNTYDKLFVLSYLDSININHGYPAYHVPSPNRTSIVTDYAIARGTYIDTHQYGNWWLRSSGLNLYEMHTTIMFNGTGDIITEKNSQGVGVRPSIWIFH